MAMFQRNVILLTFVASFGFAHNNEPQCTKPDGCESDAEQLRRVKNAAALDIPREDRERAVDEAIRLAADKYEQPPGSHDAWLTERRRFSAYDMTNASECNAVLAAAKAFTVQGRQCITSHTLFDNESPYTPRERVVSIRSVQAVRMANEQPELLQQPLDAFFTVAARMRQKIMHQFNQTELYYHLTEMVCRSTRVWSDAKDCIDQGCIPFCMEGCPEDCEALSVDESDHSKAVCRQACLENCNDHCTETCTAQDWLSHPIHADANSEDCDMLDDGLCVRRLPVDFTTHLYLNDGFEGGDFFFAKDLDDATVDELIKPTCGRMVAYSSGKENPHGVSGITSGERCLVTLWLTPDIRKAEEVPLDKNSPFLEGRIRGKGRGL